MDIASQGDDISKHKSSDNDKGVVECEEKGRNVNTNRSYRKGHTKTNEDITNQQVKSVHAAGDDFESTEEENVEKISQKEAEDRFLLWYSDIQKKEEWYQRRIEELEALDERHRQTISTLKSNDKQLQQRYSNALIKIKVLSKKNLSTTDEQAFVDSYTTLSAEKENLMKSSRENNRMIKTLKKEMLMMRSRMNLKYAHNQNHARLNASSQSKDEHTEGYHTKNPKRDRNETRIRQTKSLDGARPSGEQRVPSKASFSSLDSNKQINKNKRWEEISVETDRHTRNGIKESKPVSLPDIREKPGHIMWRY